MGLEGSTPLGRDSGWGADEAPKQGGRDRILSCVRGRSRKHNGKYNYETERKSKV